MSRINSVLKRISLSLLILPMLLAYSPAISLAETPAANSTPPSGEASQPYKYNEATGKWENNKYVWDPVTRTTQEKTPTPAPASSAAGSSTTSGTQAPFQESTSANTTPTNSTISSSPTSLSTSSVTAQQNAAANNNTAPNGTGSPNQAGIGNNIGSYTQTGDAGISQNNSAGNAASGDATAASTIINTLQSSASLDDLSKVATFTTNIDGNVFGDLHIDPKAVLAVQNSAPESPASDIRVNNETSNAINNKINVGASSGNATISDNTRAGDATSGNANAVVNLVNVLNSAIAAKESFLGLININGDFNGDILLPPGTLNALLAANSNGDSSATTNENNNLNVSSNAVNTIANNVATRANSGNATVSDNTHAGDATSGNASTNVTILNLTGHEVVGSNSLLVFVNVLGRWVGAIMDAPAGSTAAAIGGGVSEHNAFDSDVSLATTGANTINNDVDVNAHSGDASVNHNTSAGNARSGNASASANIANIANSSLSLSDWFGILFINVFGLWNGSFGIDTAAGNAPEPTARPSRVVAAAHTSEPRERVFRFTPSSRSSSSSPARQIADILPDSQLGQTNDIEQQNDQAGVLGASSNDTSNPSSQHTALFSPSRRDVNIAASAVVAGAILIGIERTLAYRDNRKVKPGRI